MPRGADPAQGGPGRRAVARLALVALVASGLAGCHHGDAPHHAADRNAAPELGVTDLSGKPLSLKAMRGKVVVLDFWATWCEPCLAEMPRLEALQHQEGPRGLQVIGLSMDDRAQTVRDFLGSHPLPYPVAMATPELAERYGRVLGLPTLVIIDRQGHMAYRHVGILPEATLKARLDRLLAE